MQTSLMEIPLGRRRGRRGRSRCGDGGFVRNATALVKCDIIFQAAHDDDRDIIPAERYKFELSLLCRTNS